MLVKLTPGWPPGCTSGSGLPRRGSDGGKLDRCLRLFRRQAEKDVSLVSIDLAYPNKSTLQRH